MNEANFISQNSKIKDQSQFFIVALNVQLLRRANNCDLKNYRFSRTYYLPLTLNILAEIRSQSQNIKKGGKDKQI